MEAVTPFLFPALLVLAFYLLIIRPARTRTRAAAELREQLAPGLEVMTTSGLFATVVSVEDDSVVLEVSPGVTMRFAKAAVARVLTSEALDDDDQAAVQTDDRPESDQPAR